MVEDSSRGKHINSKSYVDMVRLPPFQDSYHAYIPHVQRINHHVACYRCAAEHSKPHDEGKGWLKIHTNVDWPIVYVIVTSWKMMIPKILPNSKSAEMLCYMKRRNGDWGSFHWWEGWLLAWMSL